MVVVFNPASTRDSHCETKADHAYFMDSGRAPQKMPSFAAAMLKSHPATSAARTGNTPSVSYYIVGYVNLAAFT
jgi:hypothetical protein